ncbi:hypothetical protein [Pseudomonas putida]|uniref:hypothetical protein n=1 Tax=Pseudomonas putida TaxID=303 RepID=UPI0035A40BCF
MSIDPRDLFVSLNPTGLSDTELEMDRSGFMDDRTHSDYLIFLAGYKAGAGDEEESECQRHRPINAEGCKPDSNIQLSDLPCAGAASCRSLDKAEGEQPDLNNPSPDLNAASAWLEAARRNLNSAVEQAYPIGSKLMVDRGTHHARVEVVSHPNAAHPGTISVQNIKTGKRYRIDYSRVLEQHHD